MRNIAATVAISSVIFIVCWGWGGGGGGVWGGGGGGGCGGGGGGVWGGGGGGGVYVVGAFMCGPLQGWAFSFQWVCGDILSALLVSR